MSKKHKRNKKKANAKVNKKNSCTKVNKDKKKSDTQVNAGVSFYNLVGKVFIFVGICSFLLLGLVSTVPQDYEKYNIPLCFGIWGIISLLLIIIGVIPIILGKYSKKYQIWVKKDLESYGKKLLKAELKKKKIRKT